MESRSFSELCFPLDLNPNGPSDRSDSCTEFRKIMSFKDWKARKDGELPKLEPPPPPPFLFNDFTNGHEFFYAKGHLPQQSRDPSVVGIFEYQRIKNAYGQQNCQQWNRNGSNGIHQRNPEPPEQCPSVIDLNEQQHHNAYCQPNFQQGNFDVLNNGMHRQSPESTRKCPPVMDFSQQLDKPPPPISAPLIPSSSHAPSSIVLPVSNVYYRTSQPNLNGAQNTQRKKLPTWIPKPIKPTDLEIDRRITKEEKKILWRAYRQNMKPFQNKVFHNAKRVVQRFGKKPPEELDEKKIERLARAREFCEEYKLMLSQRAAIRELKLQKEKDWALGQQATNGGQTIHLPHDGGSGSTSQEPLPSPPPFGQLSYSDFVPPGFFSNFPPSKPPDSNRNPGFPYLN